MEWLIFTSQLPASPSSLRVMVWRRMRAAGAIGLQNAVWVLPRAKKQERVLVEVLNYLKEQGGEGQLFKATALGEKVEKDLLSRFQRQSDAEYAELIERCEGMLAELEKETKMKKFTFAELEENEDDFEKLNDWLGRIKTRDQVGGKRAEQAVRSLEACRKALQIFAHLVYDKENLISKEIKRND